MFPPSPSPKKRVRGVRKVQVAFKPPADLKEHIDQMAARGHSVTDVVTEMVQLARDLSVELGADFYEAERIGKVEGISTGKVLARLVKVGLGKSKR